MTTAHEINEARRAAGLPQLTGPIDFRRSRRVTGPYDYTFPHAGGWIRSYNMRRKPKQLPRRLKTRG